MSKSPRKDNQSQGKHSNEKSNLQQTKTSRDPLSTPSSDFDDETSDEDDYVGSSSDDFPSEDSVNNIFNALKKNKAKKDPAPKKNEEEELAAEREKEKELNH